MHEPFNTLIRCTWKAATRKTWQFRHSCKQVDTLHVADVFAFCRFPVSSLQTASSSSSEHSWSLGWGGKNLRYCCQGSPPHPHHRWCSRGWLNMEIFQKMTDAHVLGKWKRWKASSASISSLSSLSLLYSNITASSQSSLSEEDLPGGGVSVIGKAAFSGQPVKPAPAMIVKLSN